MKMDKERIISQIKQWIQYDNEIRTLQQEIKTRKKAKEDLNKNLINIMKDQDIDSFNINNGSLELKRTTTKKPITKKMLQNLLNNFFQGNAEKSDQLHQYIHENREISVKENIVRKIDKNSN